LMQAGATKAQAEGAIAGLDGLEAGGDAHRKLVSTVARLRRMGCTDEEIVPELVAKGYDKAAVEGALRGLNGLADGRIAQGHANAASTRVTLVRLEDTTTRNWVDMKVEQNNDKRDGLSHVLVINYPKLATLYGSDQQACQLVTDDVKKQQTREQAGQSKQADKDRCKRVAGNRPRLGDMARTRSCQAAGSTGQERSLHRVAAGRTRPCKPGTDVRPRPSQRHRSGTFRSPTWEPRTASPAIAACTPRSRSGPFNG
jgi:hypothetical protein